MRSVKLAKSEQTEQNWYKMFTAIKNYQETIIGQIQFWLKN